VRETAAFELVHPCAQLARLAPQATYPRTCRARLAAAGFFLASGAAPGSSPLATPERRASWGDVEPVPEDREGLSIGQLSELTGCAVETIRYYERVGILSHPPRTESGRRTYSDAHIRQLSFIRRARALGFSIKRIAQLLALAAMQPQDTRRVQAILDAHLAEVRSQIAELERIASQVSALLENDDTDSMLSALKVEKGDT
jgi:MerR family transcriptional regulator, mercuric resistance operon regulatory protein